MSLPSDVRIALRGMARSPGFVVAAVASLGLAIGASIAAFSIIDTIRFRELPFPAANRLVVFGESPTNVSAGIIVVSRLASYAPARRASRVDPLIAMRVD